MKLTTNTSNDYSIVNPCTSLTAVVTSSTAGLDGVTDMFHSGELSQVSLDEAEKDENIVN